MGTDIDFGSLFVMFGDEPVQIMDEVENITNFESTNKNDERASISLKSMKEPITFTANIKCRKHRRRAVGMKWPFNWTNNWLKMHGYPMVRSVSLRKRRTRSKKKYAKRQDQINE